MGRIIALLFFLSLLPVTAGAVPSVSTASISGTTVTIVGTGFGTKSPAAPIFWDDFESGVDGTDLRDNANWDQSDGGTTGGGEYSSVQAYSGSQSGYRKICNPADCADSMGQVITVRHAFVSNPQTELYYTYRWTHTTHSTLNYGIVKAGRIGWMPDHSYGGSGTDSGTSYISAFNPANDVPEWKLWGYHPLEGNLVGDWFSNPNGALVEGNWDRHTMYMRLSSTPGTADGGYQFTSYADESDSVASDAAVTVSVGADFDRIDSILLGLMSANTEDVGKEGSDLRLFVDDVYVDNTRSRVELCTGSTWATKTDCNPQPPTVWTGGTNITATLNRGDFPDGTAYIYVVDDSGDANTTGKAVTLGASTGSGSIVAGSGSISAGSGSYQ